MAQGTISIGKIVRSDSHVRYTCQVFGAGETAYSPKPSDYAFGSFVRLPLRVILAEADATRERSALPPANQVARADTLPSASTRLRAATCAVGLLYDTILVNPEFGTLGPRLSSETQVELFSPNYLTERAVLVSILLLGTMREIPGVAARARHGVPPIAPDLGTLVTSMTDAEVRSFHVFADEPEGGRPYLHMGYLPHAIAQVNPLLPLAMLHTVERLEQLCPENAALLSIVKRNFAWRLKVETAG